MRSKHWFNDFLTLRINTHHAHAKTYKPNPITPIIQRKTSKKRKLKLYLLKSLKRNNIFIKTFGGFKIKQ